MSSLISAHPESGAGRGCGDEEGSGQTVALTAALCDIFKASAGSKRSLLTRTELWVHIYDLLTLKGEVKERGLWELTMVQSGRQNKEGPLEGRKKIVTSTKNFTENNPSDKDSGLINDL